MINTCGGIIPFGSLSRLKRAYIHNLSHYCQGNLSYLIPNHNHPAHDIERPVDNLLLPHCCQQASYYVPGEVVTGGPTWPAAAGPPPSTAPPGGRVVRSAGRPAGGRDSHGRSLQRKFEGSMPVPMVLLMPPSNIGAAHYLSGKLTSHLNNLHPGAHIARR